MDPNERLKAILSLLYEIDKLENAQKSIQSRAELDANREEQDRLRAKLDVLLAEDAGGGGATKS